MAERNILDRLRDVLRDILYGSVPESVPSAAPSDAEMAEHERAILKAAKVAAEAAADRLADDRPMRGRIRHFVYGITARREGCDKCGRGVLKVHLASENGETAVLQGDIAHSVWLIFEDELKRAPAWMHGPAWPAA